MPITQPRLLQILQAAEFYRQQLLAFRQSAIDLANRAARGSLSPGEALGDIALLISTIPNELPYATLITRERVLYDHTRAKNLRIRDRQRRRRFESKHGRADGPDGTNDYLDWKDEYDGDEPIQLFEPEPSLLPAPDQSPTTNHQSLSADLSDTPDYLPVQPEIKPKAEPEIHRPRHLSDAEWARLLAEAKAASEDLAKDD